MKVILQAVRKKRFVLFGEIHGTKEIPVLLQELIPIIIPDCLFLEIPADQQAFVNKYLRNNHQAIPFFARPLPDGRGSKQYFDLIRIVREHNRNSNKKISVWCVDAPLNKKIINRDKFMYEQISKKARKKNVFIAGNKHASLIPIRTKKSVMITAGSLLKKRYPNQVISINLMPCKGRFYNFGIKNIKTNCNAGLKKVFWKKTGHDYFYYLKSVTPATFLAVPKNQLMFS